MHFIQVLCAVFVLVNVASTKGYGSGGNVGTGPMSTGAGVGGYGANGGGIREEGIGGYGAGGRGNVGGLESYAPKPYGFGYDAPDEFGNGHFRKEQGDGRGNVQGSYGYIDKQGLFRQVDYLADASGFKAMVKTNEPGTGKQNPADVNMAVQQTPPGIQEKYTGNSAYGRGPYGAGVQGGIGTGPAGNRGGVGIGGNQAGAQVIGGALGDSGVGRPGGAAGRYSSGPGGNNAAASVGGMGNFGGIRVGG